MDEIDPFEISNITTNHILQVDPCTVNGNPCKNDAKCLALKQGRYKCECPAGWEGMHCEENIGKFIFLSSYSPQYALMMSI